MAQFSAEITPSSGSLSYDSRSIQINLTWQDGSALFPTMTLSSYGVPQGVSINHVSEVSGSDGSTKITLSVTGTTKLTSGTKDISINLYGNSASGGVLTKTLTFSLTVDGALVTITKPDVKSAYKKIEYTGSTISIKANSTYFDFWDDNKVYIKSSTTEVSRLSGEAVGTYEGKIGCNFGYQFDSSGSTETKYSWQIVPYVATVKTAPTGASDTNWKPNRSAFDTSRAGEVGKSSLSKMQYGVDKMSSDGTTVQSSGSFYDNIVDVKITDIGKFRPKYKAVAKTDELKKNVTDSAVDYCEVFTISKATHDLKSGPELLNANWDGTKRAWIQKEGVVNDASIEYISYSSNYNPDKETGDWYSDIGYIGKSETGSKTIYYKVLANNSTQEKYFNGILINAGEAKINPIDQQGLTLTASDWSETKEYAKGLPIILKGSGWPTDSKIISWELDGLTELSHDKTSIVVYGNPKDTPYIVYYKTSKVPGKYKAGLSPSLLLKISKADPEIIFNCDSFSLFEGTSQSICIDNASKFGGNLSIDKVLSDGIEAKIIALNTIEITASETVGIQDAKLVLKTSGDENYKAGEFSLKGKRYQNPTITWEAEDRRAYVFTEPIKISFKFPYAVSLDKPKSYSFTFTNDGVEGPISPWPYSKIYTTYTLKDKDNYFSFYLKDSYYNASDVSSGGWSINEGAMTHKTVARIAPTFTIDGDPNNLKFAYELSRTIDIKKADQGWYEYGGHEPSLQDLKPGDTSNEFILTTSAKNFNAINLDDISVKSTDNKSLYEIGLNRIKLNEKNENSVTFNGKTLNGIKDKYEVIKYEDVYQISDNIILVYKFPQTSAHEELIIEIPVKVLSHESPWELTDTSRMYLKGLTINNKANTGTRLININSTINNNSSLTISANSSSEGVAKATFCEENNKINVEAQDYGYADITAEANDNTKYYKNDSKSFGVAVIPSNFTWDTKLYEIYQKENIDSIYTIDELNLRTSFTIPSAFNIKNLVLDSLSCKELEKVKIHVKASIAKGSDELTGVITFNKFSYIPEEDDSSVPTTISFTMKCTLIVSAETSGSSVDDIEIKGEKTYTLNLSRKTRAWKVTPEKTKLYGHERTAFTIESGSGHDIKYKVSYNGADPKELTVATTSPKYSFSARDIGITTITDEKTAKVTFYSKLTKAYNSKDQTIELRLNDFKDMNVKVKPGWPTENPCLIHLNTSEVYEFERDDGFDNITETLSLKDYTLTKNPTYDQTDHKLTLYGGSTEDKTGSLKVSFNDNRDDRIFKPSEFSLNVRSDKPSPNVTLEWTTSSMYAGDSSTGYIKKIPKKPDVKIANFTDASANGTITFNSSYENDGDYYKLKFTYQDAGNEKSDVEWHYVSIVHVSGESWGQQKVTSGAIAVSKRDAPTLKIVDTYNASKTNVDSTRTAIEDYYVDISSTSGWDENIGITPYIIYQPEGSAVTISESATISATVKKYKVSGPSGFKNNPKDIIKIGVKNSSKFYKSTSSKEFITKLRAVQGGIVEALLILAENSYVTLDTSGEKYNNIFGKVLSFKDISSNLPLLSIVSNKVIGIKTKKFDDDTAIKSETCKFTATFEGISDDIIGEYQQGDWEFDGTIGIYRNAFVFQENSQQKLEAKKIIPYVYTEKDGVKSWEKAKVFVFDGEQWKPIVS